jgi:hypothetical protein
MASRYSVGAYEDSNGFKVTIDDGVFLGWVYPMGYIEGREGTWGAISNAGEDVSDPSLYREGLDGKQAAAEWLAGRAWSL